MRIVFVRHGEPDYENDCLTARGHIQAGIAAKRLMEEGIDKIFSSPMGRALQTAQAFSEESGLKSIEILDFMREIEWGDTDGVKIPDDGHPWALADRLAKEDYMLTDHNWKEHPYFKNNFVRDDFELIEEGTDKWLKCLGYEREGNFYRNNRENADEYTVALFCHGGSSSSMLGHIFNLPLPFMVSAFHIQFTGITVVRFDKTPGSIVPPILEIACDARHVGLR